MRHEMATVLIASVILCSGGCGGDSKSDSSPPAPKSKVAQSEPAKPDSDKRDDEDSKADDKQPDTKSVEGDNKPPPSVDGEPKKDDKNEPARPSNDATDNAKAGAAAGDEKPQDIAQDTAEKNQGETNAKASKPVRKGFRLLLMFDDRPLLIECLLDVGGKPYSIVEQKTIAKLMELADSNKDNRATWSELVVHPDVKSGQYGNRATSSDEQQQNAIRTFDSDRDGFVDLDELRRFLGGRTESLLTLRNTANQFGGNNADWFGRLDGNGDGSLDSRELNLSATRLRLDDLNADGRLSADELAPAPSPFQPTMRQPVVQNQGRLVALIEAKTEWGTVLADMERVYAFGGIIEANNMPNDAKFFEAMDGDGDGQIQLKEAKRLFSDVRPHIRIHVKLSKQSELALDETTSLPSGVTARKTGSSRIMVGVGEQVVEMNAENLSSRFEEQARQLLTQFDQNNDKYLDPEEWEEVPFEVEMKSVDRDGDEKVYEAELAEFLRSRAEASSSRIAVGWSMGNNSLFTLVDTNGDGELSEREILQATVRLKQADKDQDGTLNGNEIPSVLRLSFGTQPQATPTPQLPGMQQPIRSDNTQGPEWFRKMDRNGDGEISSGEFLGSPAQFSQRDKNNDGFLKLDEVKDASR